MSVEKSRFLALLPTIYDTQKTLAMTLSFASILSALCRYDREKLIPTHVADNSCTAPTTINIFGSCLNVEMSYLTRVTKDLFLSFFCTLFNCFSQSQKCAIAYDSILSGMAHTLSISLSNPKTLNL